MSKALQIIESTVNQTFDCGIVLEVLNTDLTKKHLTVLVNSKDEWNGCNLFSALEYVNSQLTKVAKSDSLAMGYKSTGFKMVKDDTGKIIFEKFIDWKPQHIPRKTNQG